MVPSHPQPLTANSQHPRQKYGSRSRGEGQRRDRGTTQGERQYGDAVSIRHTQRSPVWALILSYASYLRELLDVEYGVCLKLCCCG